MPNIDALVPSKSNFLAKEDVGEAGKNLTIARFVQKEVGFEGDKEMKAVIEWREPNFKPMVMNKENATRLKMICQTNDTDQMIGKVVNVYNDKFVKFGTEMKGGLRIRPVEHANYQNNNRPQSQPQAQPQPQQAQAPRSQEPEDNGPPSPPLESYQNEPPRW